MTGVTGGCQCGALRYRAEGLFDLPEVAPAQAQEDADWNAQVISNQHPDHDTDR
ncbi:hypothetical protein [Pelagibius litoralis]|uniref:hypothetical protein n=1 Tax=Pelagibius litoralis TaxID=374515 RepID=UPI00197E8874|nr:hypothetical protein [Pelagibius litoralis]